MNTAKPEVLELGTRPEKHPADRSKIRRWGSHALAIIMKSDDHSQTSSEQKQSDKIDRFLNPRSSIETTDQISLMSEFWSQIGLDLPLLTQSQQTTLERTAANYPRYRILPTPLLSTFGRQSLINRASDLALVRLPGVGTPQPLNTGRNIYELRYKTPGGQVVDREAYIAALMTAGQAVDADDGTAWIFPLTDVSLGRRHSGGRTLADLYESAGPIACPETIMAVQSLRIAAGRAHRRCEVVISNEALYRLGGETGIDSLERVIGVDWDPELGIGLDPLVPTDNVNHSRHGVRTIACDSVSGL